jgi:hypothetical protein
MRIISPGYLLSILTATIPQLVIFSASVIYLVKLRRIDSVLLFIGSFIGMLVTAFYFIIKPLINMGNTVNYLEQDIGLMNFIGLINVLGSSAFCIGFLLLIIYSNRKSK